MVSDPVSDDILQPQSGHVGEHVVGVGPTEEGIEEDPVRLPVQLAYGLEVGFRARVRRADRGEVQGEAEAETPGRTRATGVTDETVTEHLGGEPQPGPGGGILDAGSVGAGDVPQKGRAPRLVQGRPDPHPVAESVVDGWA